MHIKNVKLTNYRGYKDLEVEFAPGINLVIGNNGAGKSSMLSGIRAILEELFATTKGMSRLTLFENNDVRISEKKIGDTTYSYQKNYPMYVECSIDYKGELIKVRRGVEGEGVIEGGSMVGSTFYGDLLKNNTVMIPLINYQRFDRGWSRKNNQGNQLNIEMGPTDRVDGLKGTLSDTNIDDIISRWCLKMSMIEMERGRQVQEFSTFKKIISNFLIYLMDEKTNIDVSYSIEQGGLVFKSQDSNQPIINLSTGYRAVLSMIMELAYRTVVVNPTIDYDLKQLEGILLVDEIDAHMHPRWQWKILGALKQSFPSFQIIVATHSPMVISSAKDAHIIKLENSSIVTYLPEAYGMATDDILELRQGSINTPDEVKAIRDELENAFLEEDINIANKVLNKAKKKYGSNSSVYKSLKDSYEINMWMVENE